MKYAAEARKQLGRRTIFNIIGPLCNPANATHQLVGVFSEDLLHIVARALAALGTKKALVIHSKDGLDEISTTGLTMMCECSGGDVVDYEVEPETFGFKRVSVEDLRGGTVEENAAALIAVLKGEKGIKRDIVLLNAAGALYAAGRVASIAEGINLAAAAVDSGVAIKN